MFTYWKGYEIDGSSTAYNIVVPQREMISEVLRYFISLKIIDRKSDISLSYTEREKSASNKYECENGKYKHDETEKICEILESLSVDSFFINADCIHPDKLFHQVRNELYSLSKTRPGAKDRVYNYINPTVSPFRFGPDLGVTFEVSLEEEQAIENHEPEGLVFNRDALVNNMRGQHFTITLG
ncbi:MAG TPA: hypothetical protein PLA01_09455, partial [Acetivibrio sp.]|nr:hypothetical protein [Acetivibrio sp.]